MSAAASSLTTPRVITLLVCSCKTSISWSTFSLKNKRKITHATVTDKPWVQHRNSIVSTYWSRICSTVVDMIFASSCSVWCSSSRSISVTDLIWSTVYSSSKRVLHRGQVIGRFSLDRCYIQDTVPDNLYNTRVRKRGERHSFDFECFGANKLDILTRKT